MDRPQNQKPKKNNHLIYKLFENLNEYDKRRFMRRFGLFQATFLDPDFEARIKNINKLIRYNTDDPMTKKMLVNMERFVKSGKKVLLIDNNSLNDRTIAQYNGLYDVVDSNDQLLLLKQVDADKDEQIELLKQRKENGFCNANLFSVDYELVKAVIPKILDEYRKTSKHVPDNVSEGEWDTILREIVWFCNEYVTEFKRDNKTEEYKERLAHAKEMFVSYFMELL